MILVVYLAGRYPQGIANDILINADSLVLVMYIGDSKELEYSIDAGIVYDV